MSFQLCQSVNRNTAVIPSYRTAYDKKYLKVYDARALAQNTRPSCNASVFAKNNAFAQSKYVYPIIESFRKRNKRGGGKSPTVLCPLPPTGEKQTNSKCCCCQDPAQSQCIKGTYGYNDDDCRGIKGTTSYYSFQSNNQGDSVACE